MCTPHFGQGRSGGESAPCEQGEVVSDQPRGILDDPTSRGRPGRRLSWPGATRRRSPVTWQLFAAWLGLVAVPGGHPAWDQQLGTLAWCIDQALRAVGGALAYLLTDNARTVTVDHVAGIPVRHPEIVELGRHYGCKVETCVPSGPESKGGVEATAKITKADLVPSGAILLPAYGSFAQLDESCRQFCDRASLMPWRWARSGWWPMTRLSGSGQCATPPRPATPARGCGAGSPGRNW